MRHDLKTLTKSFAAILNGLKKHEIRVNDHDFSEGDELYLSGGAPLR
jgi:hypothetical protein